MTPQEISRELEELEGRLERLRVKYDLYFQGIEKMLPFVARKDVHRRFAALHKEQLRSAALRFRFNSLVQRFTSYQTHWGRILRQIEEGTYKRDLLRAKRLVQRLDQADAGGRRDTDDEVRDDDVYELSDDALDDAHDDLGDALGGESLLRETIDLPPMPDSGTGPWRPGVPVPPGLSGLRQVPPSEPPLSDDGFREFQAPPPAPIPAMPAAHSSTQGLREPLPMPRPVNPWRPGAAPLSPLAPRPLPSPGSPGAPTTPVGAPAVPAPSGPAVTPPRPAPGRPLAAPLPPPARPATGPVPVPPPGMRPAVGPLPPPRPLGAPGATPARPAPAPAPAARPAATSDDPAIQSLYQRYLDARRQTGESTEVRYESVARQVRESLPKLAAQYQGADVKFDVSIKDGRAVLRPVVTVKKKPGEG